LAVHLGAIGAADVLDADASLVAGDDGVLAADAGVFDGDVTGAADAICAGANRVFTPILPDQNR
jgi:hypothetical protein